MKRREFLAALGVATACLTLPAWLEDPDWEPPNGPAFQVYLANEHRQVSSTLQWNGQTELTWMAFGGTRGVVVTHVVVMQGGHATSIPLAQALTSNGGDIHVTLDLGGVVGA